MYELDPEKFQQQILLDALKTLSAEQRRLISYFFLTVRNPSKKVYSASPGASRVKWKKIDKLRPLSGPEIDEQLRVALKALQDHILDEHGLFLKDLV